eukprot:Hpha_TRINITY_DN9130_c0_g1::TRINITY_DN9130_c0_g1_i1::g.94536::m.94536
MLRRVVLSGRCGWRGAVRGSGQQAVVSCSRAPSCPVVVPLLQQRRWYRDDDNDRPPSRPRRRQDNDDDDRPPRRGRRYDDDDDWDGDGRHPSRRQDDRGRGDRDYERGARRSVSYDEDRGRPPREDRDFKRRPSRRDHSYEEDRGNRSREDRERRPSGREDGDRRPRGGEGPPSSRGPPSSADEDDGEPMVTSKAAAAAMKDLHQSRQRGIDGWLGFGGRWAPAEREGKFVKGETEWEGAESQHLCEVPWSDRPLPPTHHRRPEEPQWEGPRSKRDRGAGGWQGRKEDEERRVSGWKSTGGPWSWRVVCSECDLSRNGYDVTRERQSKPWSAAMAGAVLTTGQHEWEIRCTGHTRAMRVGVCREDFDVFENAAWGDQAPKSWVLTDLGSSWHNERMVSRGLPYRASGDVVTCHCNMDEGTLHFSINGERQPGEFTGLKGPLRPVVNFREIPATAEMRHIYSSEPPEDAGPYFLGKLVYKGQVKDISIPEH